RVEKEREPVAGDGRLVATQAASALSPRPGAGEFDVGPGPKTDRGQVVPPPVPEDGPPDGQREPGPGLSEQPDEPGSVPVESVQVERVMNSTLAGDLILGDDHPPSSSLRRAY